MECLQKLYYITQLCALQIRKTKIYRVKYANENKGCDEINPTLQLFSLRISDNRPSVAIST